jgi:PHD/YefM family antitoxin component YafN of YafNO toxin-antitoxin module
MMVTVHPDYVVDEKQNKKSVILSLEDWEHIVEELEELDDIRAYDEAKSGPQDTVPFEQAAREIQEGSGA